jgi:hypothetical protein
LALVHHAITVRRPEPREARMRHAPHEPPVNALHFGRHMTENRNGGVHTLVTRVCKRGRRRCAASLLTGRRSDVHLKFHEVLQKRWPWKCILASRTMSPADGGSG